MPYALKLAPDIKEKWTTALRSGKYKQGRGRLRSQNGGYCCLGVLCDAINPHTWQLYEGDGQWVTKHYCDLYPSPSDTDEQTDKVLIQCADDDTFDIMPVRTFLANKNDAPRDRWDFDKIADWIDTNL